MFLKHNTYNNEISKDLWYLHLTDIFNLTVSFCSLDHRVVKLNYDENMNNSEIAQIENFYQNKIDFSI